MPQLDIKPSLFQRLRTLIIGGAKDPHDKHLFHKLSLIAFFAWVGLGADGLSSSSYGPEEAMRELLKGGDHRCLAIFVALATVLTIFVISTSYSQLIELFPSGGGGYLVASKLLSPSVGMVAGCALLIDYVLTISLSVASGTDALFSFLPKTWLPYKLEFAIGGVLLLIVANLRGVKESVVPLLPIFLVFILTHGFAIVYGVATHMVSAGPVVVATSADLSRTVGELGMLGAIILVLRAYSMGAGTFTGIEAVSNAMNLLREPRVQTGKRTMRYMAFSLGIMVMGLMVLYLLYRVVPDPGMGQTLNAILFEKMTEMWQSSWGKAFVLVTLFSEAALLFIAAQTGFLGGPAVLANMALDRWFPTRFSTLSDRFVTQNGVLIMGTAALVTMILAGGSVRVLVVLYSINVFITFCLSQTGMVRHWWQVRATNPAWRYKIVINGVGLTLSFFILVMVVVLKFEEGGWVTLAVTGALAGVAFLVRNHYNKAGKLLRRLETLVQVAHAENLADPKILPVTAPGASFDPKAKTAVLLVNGFSGLGLHTLFSVIRMFEGVFKNFVFVQVGVLDAGNFKGLEEIEHLRERIQKDLDQYIVFMRRHGYHAEGYSAISTDIVEEVGRLAPQVLDKYSGAVFFGGQLVFPEDSFMTRLLHNYVVFAVQRRLYRLGIPFVILPVRL